MRNKQKAWRTKARGINAQFKAIGHKGNWGRRFKHMTEVVKALPSNLFLNLSAAAGWTEKAPQA
jgi:hypothetical protein